MTERSATVGRDPHAVVVRPAMGLQIGHRAHDGRHTVSPQPPGQVNDTDTSTHPNKSPVMMTAAKASGKVRGPPQTDAKQRK
jgi:hypothetical protein